MSSLTSLFSEMKFEDTIRKYCDDIGWKIADINSRKAIIRFDMESGRVQTLYIIRYESTLEFSVPSAASFDDASDIPHFLPLVLLKRSSERKIGFWCIEEIESDLVFSQMHNAELRLIDVEYFENVVRALISECDDVEAELASSSTG